MGESDWLLASKEPKDVLENRMQRCTTLKLEGRSHMLLQESGIDLSNLIEVDILDDFHSHFRGLL